MISLLLYLLWWVGILVTWRIFYRIILRTEGRSYDDASDRFMYGFAALIAAALWPFVVFVWLIWRGGYFRAPEDKEAALRKRIAELERELEIR